ncbi:MAG: hypothetical protein M5U28_56185 [Sandaracinaceae bacterium]|nr:hypothetical protein [Sandaracinaceae bacterium]
MLAPEREQLYARFAALWPRELGDAGGEATLSARAVLDVDLASRPRDERDALRALARVRATTSVTLPAWCAETQTNAEPLGRSLLAALLQRVRVPSR